MKVRRVIEYAPKEGYSPYICNNSYIVYVDESSKYGMREVKNNLTFLKKTTEAEAQLFRLKQ